MDSEATKTDDLRPLLLFFDCEAARGNVFRDDIIEIAVKCQPDLHPTAEFDSLIHTSQRICSFGQENGLTARALKGQPKFPEVLDRLLVWCDGVVEQVNLQTNYKHYPVLVAHGGELFDFLMLFSHCERHSIPVDRLREHNLHFADTFIHLDEVKKSGHQLLDACPLSLDFLLNEWFPGEFSEGRHRAMVDVQLLIKIFYETPLHQFLSTLPIFSTEEWKVFYETKKEIRKDKREFGDKLWFLHEVHRKFVIRSLVRHGLNYEGLKDFYQQCRSVQHFKQEMRELMDTHVKSFSIKRIAEHFSSENLPQLGTIPYRPPTSTNKYQPACYHETDATGTHFRLRYGRKSNVRPSLPSQQTQEESPPEAEEAGPDSSSYPVGTSVSRGVPPTSGGGSLSPSAGGGSVSRGFSPAVRGRGRARPMGTRPCDAGWMYNPLHKQVPADFGNHDDGWLSDGDSASYSPDDVTPVNVQKTQVTTTLVPREGRSTIFDNDEGHTDHRNTGMSFSKIKKELEKSTASVRGRGARRRHAFVDRSQAEEGRRFEGRCKDSNQGRRHSFKEKTSEKVDKRSDGSGADFCQSHPKKFDQRRHAFEDRSQAEERRRSEARCKDSNQGRRHSFEEKTFEKVDKRSDKSGADFCQSHPKKFERRRHAFEDRSQNEEGRRFEGRCKDAHQGKSRSFEEKKFEKVDKKNEAHSRPGQKYTTSTSQHETKRSPENKGERSSTWPPVFTYAQVLTEGKSRREIDGKGVTKSAPKDSKAKDSKTKSVHKAQRADRQYRSEHDIRNGTEEQAVGFNTSEDNRKEDFCTPHPNEAEHSGNRKSAPKDSTGKESKTKSVHKTQKEAVQQYRSEHDTRNGTEEQVDFKTSKHNRKEDFCKSHLNEVDRQHAGNRRRQNQWPDLFKQRPKRENQHHQNERKELRHSEETIAKGSASSHEEKGQNQCPNHFKQRPKRENQHHQNERKELRDSEESIAKGPPSSLEEKCRGKLQEKLPRSNFCKQKTNQRPRKQKISAEKKCFCGLPHVEEDIPKSKKTSQVVSSVKISEDSTRGHLRSRPSSAKYGVLSTQDGRKKRDGPKDERKTDKPKKDAQEEESLDVSIEELLPYKNDAYKYLFTPVTNMDSSTAEEYDKLIVMYNQEFFQQKK